MPCRDCRGQRNSSGSIRPRVPARQDFLMPVKTPAGDAKRPVRVFVVRIEPRCRPATSTRSRPYWQQRVSIAFSTSGLIVRSSAVIVVCDSEERLAQLHADGDPAVPAAHFRPVSLSPSPSGIFLYGLLIRVCVSVLRPLTVALLRSSAPSFATLERRDFATFAGGAPVFLHLDACPHRRFSDPRRSRQNGPKIGGNLDCATEGGR